MKLLTLLTILLFITCTNNTAKKMRLIWLNNGGSILSFSEDWIKLKILTTELNDTIVCTDGKGYTYEAGTSRKFYRTWFPVKDNLYITLINYNLFKKDDALYIKDQLLNKSLGIYEARLTLSQFQAGVTIGLTYQGFGFEIQRPDQTHQGDYYMIFQLSNYSTNDYPLSLDQSCHLNQFYLFYPVIFIFIGFILIL